mmetsp:Transcript_11598/g.24813  ORF Transcript_11598/g.24813 Transcript_11598/m.24813 type:complete len:406 (-) Transcript_11598:42-1259(-)
MPFSPTRSTWIAAICTVVMAAIPCSTSASPLHLSIKKISGTFNRLPVEMLQHKKGEVISVYSKSKNVPKLPSSYSVGQNVVDTLTTLRGGARAAQNSPDGIISSISRESSTPFDRIPVTDSRVAKAPISRGGASNASGNNFLSLISCIFNQSINIATTALIGSGYFGAWIASWMIHGIHKIIPSMVEIANKSNENAVNKGGLFSAVIKGKWKWPIIATISYLSLSSIAGGIKSINAINDAVFLSQLWLYSRVVDPLAGGLIGCSHALLSAVSLTSLNLGDLVDDLGKVRLASLEDGERDITVENNSVLESRTTIRGAIANALSSMALVTSFPQHFLGLYLLLSILLKSLSTSDKARGWDWLSWWNEGMITSGPDSDDLNTTALRLMGLHWIDIFVKCFLAYMIKI